MKYANQNNVKINTTKQACVYREHASGNNGAVNSV